MSDQPDSPMLGWLFGGGGLVAIGAGLKWLWDKVINHRASREAKIEAREHEYVKKLEERLDDLEALVGKQGKALTEQGEELGRHRVAIMLLVNNTRAKNPKDPVLQQVRDILGKAFPVQMPVPDDITDLAARIE